MRKLAVLIGLVLVAVFLGHVSFREPAVAQGEIRVLSQTSDNHFPRDFTFLLKAEGDRDINKITLYYRIGSSSSSSYAYPTFTPGKAVEAQYVLQTSGGRYVVAGSDIQYYYEIEDTGGAMLRTDPVKVAYEDNRFSWKKLEATGVSVYYYGSDQIGNLVLEAATRALSKMNDSAGAALARPVKVYVYGSKRDMDVALPFVSQASTRDLVTEGEAFSGSDLVMILGSDPDVRGTTAHELTHLLTDQLTSNAFSSIPAWLNEGLSMFAEGNLRSVNQNALNEAIRNNTLLSLRAASSLPGRPDQINLFYGEGYSVVRYMVDTYGAEKMSKFLATIKGGVVTNDALKQVYGIDQDALEANWRAAIGARPAPAAAASGGSAQPPASVPTIAPFGSKSGAAQGSGPNQQNGDKLFDSKTVLYVGLAASVVVVSLAFLVGVVFMRRKM